ncbi:MAG TPA: radical SAM protein [Dehalococcoidia bacterium]|nr:radical SAM protein [Dehalococcoidia bacterium]
MAAFLVPPYEDGCRLTLRRLLNLYRVRWQYSRRSLKLRGYPLILTVEATNVCNLRCPACFTGAGEVGRTRSFLPMDQYRALLRELGPYAFRVEFYNWGEPLLNKDVFEMVREAKRYGASTVISTNFSVPFDAERAERLVEAGLDVLGVSLDGATQETYEKYRVRGDIRRVLENCRLVRDAKRRLGSVKPRLVWEYHVFEHNVHETEEAKRLAAELEMDISIDKGWVVGDDWDTESKFAYFVNPSARPCDFLWQRAIVQNDGGVAPCCGTFYKEDDFGSIWEGDGGNRRFREVWNNESFQTARRLFHRREGGEDARRLVCYDCPATIIWESYQKHIAAGKDPAAFQITYTTNDSFHYFFNRRPARSAPPIAEGDLLEVLPASR